MFNIHAHFCCQLLLLWIVPITFTVHDLWTIEFDHPAHVVSKSIIFPKFADRKVANFPTEFDNEFVHFFKNVGMIGGLVLYLQGGL
tara:strand:- start:413 stop:670 length:258 start_codon:yes stop_codon:yes gene_type:complete